jgi:hypothetical protein
MGNLMMIFRPVCMKRRLWVGGKKKMVELVDYQLPIGFQTTTRSIFCVFGQSGVLELATNSMIRNEFKMCRVDWW